MTNRYNLYLTQVTFVEIFPLNFKKIGAYITGRRRKYYKRARNLITTYELHREPLAVTDITIAILSTYFRP